MRRYKYQQIASKALKTMVLLTSEHVAKYIPETKWYQFETLLYMLQKYPVVYIKPDKGTGGGGIIRIRRLAPDRMEYRDLYGRKVMHVSQLYYWLNKKLNKSQKYIVQHGISLAQINGRPCDIRVLLQKPVDKWIISGMIAKVAAPGKIVTNYCKGGQPFEIFNALHLISSNDRIKAKKIFIELYYLSKEIAKILNRRFRGLRELGIDVGIDKQNKIWIFEVNTQPNFQMFRKLQNKDMYQLIQRVHRRIVV